MGLLMSVLGQKKIKLLPYLLRLPFFICFSSNLMKNITNNMQNGSIFVYKWPVVCKSM